MKFDNSVALGSMIHLVAPIIFLSVISWMASRRLKRIEKKQDALLDAIAKK